MTNWSKTVSRYVYLDDARTEEEVAKIVRQAITSGLQVGCSGFGHSWTDLFPGPRQVWIRLVPNCVSKPVPWRRKQNHHGDLNQIKLIRSDRVQVGGAVSNQAFYEFALAHNICLPYNVIILENTIAGTVSAMCHGGGWKTGVISDLVTEVKLIDRHGDWRIFGESQNTDADTMNAVRGALGTWGIMVSLTLKVEPMKYVNIRPRKMDVMKAIPRPDVTNGEDWDTFRQMVTSDYNEFFWFILSPQVYVNSWNNCDPPAKPNRFPYPRSERFQEWEEYATQLVTSTIGTQLSPVTQAKLFSEATMTFLSVEHAIVNQMDAIHFRRGIHNFRLLDAELHVPLEESKQYSGEPELNRVQQLWWIAIDQIEKWAQQGEAPIKLVLEMRIYGTSTCFLAPCVGNRWTLAIEVESFNTTWPDFLVATQTIYDAWSRVLPLDCKVRPHWAKIWQGLKWRGRDMMDYLQNDAFVQRDPKDPRKMVNQLERFKGVSERILR